MLPENELLTVVKKLFKEHLDKDKGYFIVFFPFRRPGDPADAQGEYHCIASGNHPELPVVLMRCARGMNVALGNVEDSNYRVEHDPESEID